MPTHLENLATPSSEMERHTIGVLPIINTPIGIHKVEECNTYKKMVKEQNKSNNDDKKKVTMDEDKLKKGMAGIFPSSDFNPDDLAEALAAAMAGVE